MKNYLKITAKDSNKSLVIKSFAYVLLAIIAIVMFFSLMWTILYTGIGLFVLMILFFGISCFFAFKFLEELRDDKIKKDYIANDFDNDWKEQNGS